MNSPQRVDTSHIDITWRQQQPIFDDGAVAIYGAEGGGVGGH